ncbi:MAG: hypothetical protein ACYTHK_13040 [Planctomycetota bacterium]
MGGTNDIDGRVIRYVDKDRQHGSAQVGPGFTSRTVQCDINLQLNPPPDPVEIRRPVVTTCVPIFLRTNSDQKKTGRPRRALA